MIQILFYTIFKFVHGKRNTGLEEKSKELKLNQASTTENRERLNNVENDLCGLKKELEKIRDSLILHYHRLLNEGQDTR